MSTTTNDVPASTLADPKTQTFATGAVRNTSVAGDTEGTFPMRFDLLLSNPEALQRIAATYGEGFQKYGANNWKKGFPESVLLNHAMAHLIQYMTGDVSEDHLAHAVWNLTTLMWMQQHKPELLDLTGKV